MVIIFDQEKVYINLPGATASLDAVTPRDVEFIKFAIENNADYIAQSFCKRGKKMLKWLKIILKNLAVKFLLYQKLKTSSSGKP